MRKERRCAANRADALRARIAALEGGIAELMVCTDNGCPLECIEDEGCKAYEEMVRIFQSQPSDSADGGK